MDLDVELNAAIADAFHDDGFAYTPAGGSAIPGLKGDFRRPGAQIALDDDTVAVTTTTPMMGVRLSDFPEGAVPREDDTLVLDADASAWKVVKALPNGEGMAWLHLHEA